MPDPSLERLLSQPVRDAIESAVSAHLGRPWRVATVESRASQASHPAAVLAGGGCSVFVKLGQGALARDQFDREAAGLRLLTERSDVLTPAIIGIVPIEGGAVLIMQAVQIAERQSDHWRQMGQALARLHGCKWDRFGLDTDCYWGDLYQDNSPLADWPDFFWQRRLEPRLRAAVDSGHLPTMLAAQVAGLAARMPELCGPTVAPALLHGDAHLNNFLSTAQGPVLIDPAAYYGHPEVDLAHVDIFAPVNDELFQAYQETAAIEPGFAERRDLWRLPFWLAMVEVEGARHLDSLAGVLRRYL